MAVVAYCVKCKEKKEMVDPQEGVTKNGRVITKALAPIAVPRCLSSVVLLRNSFLLRFTSRHLHPGPLGSCQRAFLFVRVTHAERVFVYPIGLLGSAPAQL